MSNSENKEAKVPEIPVKENLPKKSNEKAEVKKLKDKEAGKGRKGVCKPPRTVETSKKPRVLPPRPKGDGIHPVAWVVKPDKGPFKEYIPRDPKSINGKVFSIWKQGTMNMRESCNKVGVAKNRHLFGFLLYLQNKLHYIVEYHDKKILVKPGKGVTK